ncbi:MAG: diacylglycerol kinase [Desulfobulbus sp.]|nr:MAG: diacylglycerol kinase [Desulfobulbus sp.]
MKNQKPNGAGVARLIRATRCSWLGIRAVFIHEQAFRQELFLCLLLVPVGLWLGEGGVEKALLLGCLVLILIVEILNSAVEAVVDRISSEQHELSGRAKDLGSAAVSLALLHAGIVWLFVLG